MRRGQGFVSLQVTDARGEPEPFDGLSPRTLAVRASTYPRVQLVQLDLLRVAVCESVKDLAKHLPRAGMAEANLVLEDMHKLLKGDAAAESLEEIGLAAEV